MPNRIIKESIWTSRKLATLSDFEFRVWVCLITYVDDYGRGDAMPEIIKGKVFPLLEKATVKKVESALEELAKKGCIIFYMVADRKYFYFPSWKEHQRIRKSIPKCPAPQICDSSPQFAASCGELPLNPIQSESNPNPNPNPESILQPGAGDVPPSVPVASLMLNDKTYHHIYQEDVDHYRELYPAVNIEQELRNMIGWLESNPTKRKTKSGIDRFINGWLSKNQNRGGTNTYEPERPNNGEFIPSESGALSIKNLERITDPDSE